MFEREPVAIGRAASMGNVQQGPGSMHARRTGYLAVGALAVGAVAIAALAIGRLAVGRARIGRLEIDDLVVHRLRVTDRLVEPARAKAQGPL